MATALPDLCEGRMEMVWRLSGGEAARRRVTSGVTIATDSDRHQRTGVDHSHQFIAAIRKQKRPTEFPDAEAIIEYDVARAWVHACDRTDDPWRLPAWLSLWPLFGHTRTLNAAAYCVSVSTVWGRQVSSGLSS